MDAMASEGNDRFRSRHPRDFLPDSDPMDLFLPSPPTLANHDVPFSLLVFFLSDLGPFVDVAMTHGVSLVVNGIRPDDSITSVLEKVVEKVRTWEEETGERVLQPGCDLATTTHRCYKFGNELYSERIAWDVRVDMTCRSESLHVDRSPLMLFRDFSTNEDVVDPAGQEAHPVPNWDTMYSYLVEQLEGRACVDINTVGFGYSPRKYEYLAEQLFNGFQFADHGFTESGGYVDGRHVFFKHHS